MTNETIQQWKNMLRYVGMKYEILSGNGSFMNERFYVRVVRDVGGLVSYGSGDTLLDAVCRAAWGQNIDWFSVQRKVEKEELDRQFRGIMAE